MAIDFELDNGEYLSVADHASLKLSGAWSISVWIKVESWPAAAGWGYIIGKTSGVAEDYFIRLFNDGGTQKLQAYYNGAGATWTHDLNLATWYNIIVTETGSSGTITIYKNGVSKASAAGGADVSTTKLVYIGAYNGASRYYDGQVEDLRLFDDLLSAGEIAILAGGSTAAIGDEVAWWKMIEAAGVVTWVGEALDAGETIDDASANSNTATPANTPTGAAWYLNWHPAGSPIWWF